MPRPTSVSPPPQEDVTLGHAVTWLEQLGSSGVATTTRFRAPPCLLPLADSAPARAFHCVLLSTWL